MTTPSLDDESSLKMNDTESTNENPTIAKDANGSPAPPQPGDPQAATDLPPSGTPNRESSLAPPIPEADPQQAPTKPFQRGLSRTAEERQAKLDAMAALSAVAVQHPGPEVGSTASNKGFQQGSRCTSDQWQDQGDTQIISDPEVPTKCQGTVQVGSGESTTKAGHDEAEINVPPFQSTIENTNKSPTPGNDAPSGLRKIPRKPTTEVEVGAVSVPTATSMGSPPAMVPLRGLQKNKHKKSGVSGASKASAAIAVGRGANATTCSPSPQDSLSGLRKRVVPDEQGTPKAIQRGLRRTSEERKAKLEAQTTSIERPSMHPLRGLSKNREQKHNHTTTSLTNDAHGRGLRKNAPPRRGSGNEASDLEDLKPSYLPYLTEPPENQGVGVPVGETAPGAYWGAYDVTPGGGERVAPFPLVFGGSSDLEGIIIDDDKDSMDDDEKIATTHNGLAEALPVHDEDSEHNDRPQAQEVDPESLQQARENQRQKHQKKVCYATLALVALFIVVGVVVAVVVSDGQHDDDTVFPLVPTEKPSPAPTTSPTAAPTTLIMDLPEVTKTALRNPFSPQSRAHDWISTHPNITDYQDWRRRQLFAMATFYYAFMGENWTPAISADWLDVSKSECNWFSNVFSFLDFDMETFEFIVKGFDTNETVCDQEQRLQILDLTVPEGIVGGTMPPEIALLTSLESFRFLAISNGGPISNMMISELGLLPNLTLLELSTSDLTGTIPPSIFAPLSNLESLNLGFNRGLTGSLPSSISVLSKLTSLNIPATSLSGELPSSIGLMTTLEHLDVASDNVTITALAPFLGGLSSLSHFDAQENGMSGVMPSQLGLITALTALNFGYNQLSGSIPSELGFLTRLTLLTILGNQFSGTIPTFLGRMQALEQLTLYDNPFLRAPIPSELGMLFNLDDLRLNIIEGQVPPELCALDLEILINCTNMLCDCNCTCWKDYGVGGSARSWQ